MLSFKSAFSKVERLSQSEQIEHLQCILLKHHYRAFHHILNLVVGKPFYNKYVPLPPADVVPPEFWINPKFFPYFKGCLGAVDGSLLNAFVSSIDMACYHSH